MSDIEYRFWIVYSSDNEPTRYDVFGAALDAAKKLADENPGLSFYVMEAIAGFVAPLPEVQRINMHYRPGTQ